MTKQMTIEEAEAAYDDVVARAEAGELIEITRDGRVVACIGPVTEELADEIARSTFVWPTPRYPED
jgi:antitoxin (DNA-binding transcriptional repressor) of toxin-antitoxin stability system